MKPRATLLLAALLIIAGALLLAVYLPNAPSATPTAAAPAATTGAPVAVVTTAPAATRTAELPAATRTQAPAATRTTAPARTHTPIPTATDTPAPTATRTLAPTSTRTRTPVPTATRTPVPTATRTVAPTPTRTRTLAPTATRTLVPTATRTPSRTPTRTATRTATRTPAPTATPTRAINLQPCQVGHQITARCGTIAVPENRADPSSRMIDVRVAIVKASYPQAAPDPIFFISGEPGVAATEDFAWTVSALPELHLRHDFVLVDQRGTGGSHPLQCATEPPNVLELTPEQRDTVYAAWGEDCLGAVDGDIRYYTTGAAMDDLDAVRAALGYEHINLWGGAYGATAIQYYLLQHGDRVRTATLTGAALLGTHVQEQWPRTHQAALDALFAACAANAPCDTAFPDLVTQFETLLERLEQNPPVVNVTDPETRQTVRLSITRGVFYVVVMHMLSDTGQTRLLPRVIYQAYINNYNTVAREYLKVRSTANDLARLMLRAPVYCYEDWAVAAEDELTAQAEGAYFAAEELDRVRVQQALCRFLPASPLPTGFATTITSRVPVLIQQGEVDSQGPPEFVAAAQTAFPNGLVVVFPGEAYSMADQTCRFEMFTQFIELGTTAGLDTSCVQELRLPLFDTRR